MSSAAPSAPDVSEDQPVADYDDTALAAQQEKHVHSTDEQDAILHVKVDEEVIELNSLRLFAIDEVDLTALVNCTCLEMRKNLIHKLIVLPTHLRAQLDTLDLFDNKIRNIGPYFSHCDSDAFTTSKLPLTMPQLLAANGGNGCFFSKLRKLDLSYNQIPVIKGLDDLAGTLEELYLVENRIKVIEGLGKLTKLKLLELGGNQIRSCVSGLETLVELEQLWLGKNKIDTIGTGLHALRKLRRLSLQANRLTDASITPAVFSQDALPQLEELYLSENGITTLRHLQHLPTVTLLDVSFNPIKSLKYARDAAPEDGAVAEFATDLDVAHFPDLEEFWLTDGELSDWREIEEVFRPFQRTLRTVYLERNPIEKDTRYRSKVYAALPFVTQIDSWPVVNKSDPDADRATRR